MKMKNFTKVLASGFALSLLFSQGITNVDAKAKLDDKNKNGISDKWEKKYKLTGKSIAKMDYDKDGLATLIEYKLNLNPKKADTDNDKVSDGQEDKDKDGLSNLAEVEIGTNPVDSDTDNDKVKDGLEKSNYGVTLSKTIRELEIEIKTANNKKIEVEYKYNKKGKVNIIKIKDETKSLTKETVTALVSELQNASKLTEDELIVKIQTIFNLQNTANIQLEVKYFNGRDFEADGVDKNKNGISDKWEKKYKLTGSSIAKQDYDTDGLATLAEYQLNLDPKKADTDKDGVLDGQEDQDKDGLSNVSEIELGTNPNDSDTDDDKIKDGLEKSEYGVVLSKTIRELKVEVKSADDKEMKVEYKYDEGKMKIEIEDETNTLTQEMISSLVSTLQDSSKLSQDEIVAKILTILNVQDGSTVKVEVEYFDGHDLEIDHQDDEHDDHEHDGHED